MKKYYKVVAYILMLCLMWGTTLSHAQSATWEELSKTRQGSISLYTANQHSSHGLQQGIAKIRPTAQHIAKAMVKVGAVMAVEIAIEQLLGAVDYVMDPANNQIRYKPFADDQKIIQGQGRCRHDIYDPKSHTRTEHRGSFAQMQQFACASHKGNPYHTNSWYVDAPSPLHYKYFHFVCNGGMGANVGIICEVKGLEQQLSFEAIAEQILKNADAGQEEAIQFVGQVADELATQQEKEKQWEATKHIIANTNTNEGMDSETDVFNPEKEKDDKLEPSKECITISGRKVKVGTIGYRHDKVPPSKPHKPFLGDHYNLYKANRNPKNGQCFWQSIGAQDASSGQPPPLNSIPIEPFI